MRYVGPLPAIQSLDKDLRRLTELNPPKAEVAHDGEALQNAIWGYADVKPLVYTRKYTLYLRSGIRDLVPKASITLRFDYRRRSGHICCSRQDLPVLKAHLGRLLPEFPRILSSMSEVHETGGNGHFEFQRGRVHA